MSTLPSIINDIFNLNISVGSISNLTITHKYEVREQVAILLLDQRDVYILSKEHKVLVLGHFFLLNGLQVHETASFMLGTTLGHGFLCILTYKTFLSSSANKVVHGNVGLALAIDVIKKILQAIILTTVRYLISLSAIPSLHSSTLRPDLKFYVISLFSI